MLHPKHPQDEFNEIKAQLQRLKDLRVLESKSKGKSEPLKQEELSELKELAKQESKLHKQYAALEEHLNRIELNAINDQLSRLVDLRERNDDPNIYNWVPFSDEESEELDFLEHNEQVLNDRKVELEKYFINRTTCKQLQKFILQEIFFKGFPPQVTMGLEFDDNGYLIIDKSKDLPAVVQLKLAYNILEDVHLAYEHPDTSYLQKFKSAKNLRVNFKEALRELDFSFLDAIMNTGEGTLVGTVTEGEANLKDKFLAMFGYLKQGFGAIDAENTEAFIKEMYRMNKVLGVRDDTALLFPEVKEDEVAEVEVIEGALNPLTAEQLPEDTFTPAADPGYDSELDLEDEDDVKQTVVTDNAAPTSDTSVEKKPASDNEAKKAATPQEKGSEKARRVLKYAQDRLELKTAGQMDSAGMTGLKKAVDLSSEYLDTYDIESTNMWLMEVFKIFYREHRNLYNTIASHDQDSLSQLVKSGDKRLISEIQYQAKLLRQMHCALAQTEANFGLRPGFLTERLKPHAEFIEDLAELVGDNLDDDDKYNYHKATFHHLLGEWQKLNARHHAREYHVDKLSKFQQLLQQWDSDPGSLLADPNNETLMLDMIETMSFSKEQKEKLTSQVETAFKVHREREPSSLWWEAPKVVGAFAMTLLPVFSAETTANWTGMSSAPALEALNSIRSKLPHDMKKARAAVAETQPRMDHYEYIFNTRYKDYADQVQPDYSLNGLELDRARLTQDAKVRAQIDSGKAALQGVRKLILVNAHDRFIPSAVASLPGVDDKDTRVGPAKGDLSSTKAIKSLLNILLTTESLLDEAYIPPKSEVDEEVMPLFFDLRAEWNTIKELAEDVNHARRIYSKQKQLRSEIEELTRAYSPQYLNSMFKELNLEEAQLEKIKATLKRFGIDLENTKPKEEKSFVDTVKVAYDTAREYIEPAANNLRLAVAEYRQVARGLSSNASDNELVEAAMTEARRVLEENRYNPDIDAKTYIALDQVVSFFEQFQQHGGTWRPDQQAFSALTAIGAIYPKKEQVEALQQERDQLYKAANISPAAAAQEAKKKTAGDSKNFLAMLQDENLVSALRLIHAQIPTAYAMGYRFAIDNGLKLEQVLTPIQQMDHFVRNVAQSCDITLEDLQVSSTANEAFTALLEIAELRKQIGEIEGKMKRFHDLDSVSPRDEANEAKYQELKVYKAEHEAELPKLHAKVEELITQEATGKPYYVVRYDKNVEQALASEMSRANALIKEFEELDGIITDDLLHMTTSETEVVERHAELSVVVPQLKNYVERLERAATDMEARRAERTKYDLKDSAIRPPVRNFAEVLRIQTLRDEIAKTEHIISQHDKLTAKSDLSDEQKVLLQELTSARAEREHHLAKNKEELKQLVAKRSAPEHLQVVMYENRLYKFLPNEINDIKSQIEEYEVLDAERIEAETRFLMMDPDAQERLAELEAELPALKAHLEYLESAREQMQARRGEFLDHVLESNLEHARTYATHDAKRVIQTELEYTQFAIAQANIEIDRMAAQGNIILESSKNKMALWVNLKRHLLIHKAELEEKLKDPVTGDDLARVNDEIKAAEQARDLLIKKIAETEDIDEKAVLQGELEMMHYRVESLQRVRTPLTDKDIVELNEQKELKTAELLDKWSRGELEAPKKPVPDSKPQLESFTLGDLLKFLKDLFWYYIVRVKPAEKTPLQRLHTHRNPFNFFKGKTTSGARIDSIMERTPYLLSEAESSKHQLDAGKQAPKPETEVKDDKAAAASKESSQTGGTDNDEAEEETPTFNRQ